MRVISVALKPHPYKIFIGAFLRDFGSALEKVVGKNNLYRKRILIVSNPFLANRYGKILARSLAGNSYSTSFALIPDGEENKNLKSVERLYKICVSEKLDRTSCLVVLGGGVLGDTAGFAAATYLRGISLVHVPTTMLAMVDSSIGGKVGVDLPEAKNFVGSFYQPCFVWTDISTLKTLPGREMRNGLAEVIKYGVIADPRLFSLLEREIQSLVFHRSARMEEVIARSVRIKADVVSRDEKETKGIREILNFGHTWGHAIETVTRYKSYKHGEAIAIGMCAAGEISRKLGFWTEKERQRMENLILRAGLPIRLKSQLPGDRLMHVIRRDKKVRSGELRFVLPVKIGKVVVKKISFRIALTGLKHIQP